MLSVKYYIFYIYTLGIANTCVRWLDTFKIQQLKFNLVEKLFFILFMKIRVFFQLTNHSVDENCYYEGPSLIKNVPISCYNKVQHVIKSSNSGDWQMGTKLATISVFVLDKISVVSDT